VTRRILIRMLAAVGVAVVLATGTAAVIVTRHARSQALTAVERQADAIAATVESGARPAARQTRVFLLGRRIRRAGPQQTRELLLALPPDPRSGRIDAGERDLFYAARETSGGTIVAVRRADLAATDARPYLLALLIAALVALGAAGALALGLARRLTQPVTRLVDATARVARGEDGIVVEPAGDDELGDLGRSFNAMSGELAARRERDRTFLRSVSHELRTPLSALQGYGEGLQDGAVEPTVAGGVIVAETQRLERLVADLLELGRLENPGFAVADEPLDLAAVARTTAERFAPRARELGVAIDVDAGPASARGDAGRALQVASNLVENALRVSPPGGRVRIRAEQARLEISDHGPGLTEDDLRRAFERFYLYERYRGERPVGTGLGLAIVRQLTEAMGGRVDVRSEPAGGSTFSVQLRPA
jgi:two-component system OmpR family sensor kinase